jgi:hypothetical protein
LEIFIEIDFFCVSKLSIDLLFKLPVSRILAINIEGKIGELYNKNQQSPGKSVKFRRKKVPDLFCTL